jgi:hypothetical protein
MSGEAKNGELNEAENSETPPVEADDLTFEKAVEQEEAPGL